MSRIIKIYSLLFIALLLVFQAASMSVFSQSATVPLNISVNGTLTIADASNDSAAGKNPTINVSLELTPDLGAANVTGEANFRIRTNEHEWRLTAQRTSESDVGPTNIAARDVNIQVSTSAGSKGDPNAGSLVAPFATETSLVSIPTSNTATIIDGNGKTSIERDSTNTQNYFQVNTEYSIFPDFYFQPGTWSTTITYSLVSP